MMEKPLVAIVMGSQSDWPTMKEAADVLSALGVPFEAKIVSAHRTPDRMFDFAEGAVAQGAAKTRLPVLGVPVQSKALSGQDSLLSIVQMPKGIPVGTLAIGAPGAANAGLLAAAMLAAYDDELAARLDAYRATQTAAVGETPVD